MEDQYHIDFTTASNLEVFIARIEEIFSDWGLPRVSTDIVIAKGNFNTGTWLSQSETLTLVDPAALWERDIEFKLTRYALDNSSINAVEECSKVEGSSQVFHDILSTDNDFCHVYLSPSGPHPLARWYGLQDFVVLTPQNELDVDSTSKVKTLLSCLHIAVDNSECGLPVFLQACAPWQFYFLGLCRSPKRWIDFEMVHLERTPSQCKHLSGLSLLFKSKIWNCEYLEPVKFSICFTYKQKEWPPGTWVVGEGPLSDGSVSYDELQRLPIGSWVDPIAEVSVRTIWPHLLEHSVVDGDSYSDLNPYQAPEWRVSLQPVDDLSCLLSDHYAEFLMLVQRESKMATVSRALSGLRGVPTLGSADAPFSSELQMTLLYFLFPDADCDTAAPNYPMHMSGTVDFKKMGEDPMSAFAETRLKGMKSAPYGSLPWRLAVVMAHVVYSFGGLRAAEHLWHEFSQELIYRCEHNIPIPGLEPGYPDPRYCLLYQKLQILNCCISRRLEREKRALKTSESDSEPEEFFDASEVASESNNEGKKIKHAPWDQPTGRLSRHGDLRLLKTGEPLYIPRTQDPVPRTEDQLEEHADLLMNLGADAAGSALRATLMSASLLADMEAFKAANPGCILADFIRWFSPRDWIEESGVDEFGQGRGHLSSRMTLPGNTWQEVWEVAKPVPARCQRRLFDDTKEMEKALMFFEVQTPQDFATLLFPVMTSCVLMQLELEATDCAAPGVRDALDHLFKRAELCSRMSTVTSKNYEDLMKEINCIEKRLVQYKAIHRVFSGSQESETHLQDYLKQFVANLVVDKDVLVPGGPRSDLATILHKLLAITSSEGKKDDLSTSPYAFPAPTEKEIILRVETNKGPQRLYALLKKNEFRLCAAITSANFDTC